MSADYVKLTLETLVTLPQEKQEEVYDFAKFLKSSTAPKRKRKKGSVLNIIGLGKSGVGDVALNHNKYLYDK